MNGDKWGSIIIKVKVVHGIKSVCECEYWKSETSRASGDDIAKGVESKRALLSLTRVAWRDRRKSKIN